MTNTVELTLYKVILLNNIIMNKVAKLTKADLIHTFTRYLNASVIFIRDYIQLQPLIKNIQDNSFTGQQELSLFM